MYLFQVPLGKLKEHLIVSDGFWDRWGEKRKTCNGCGTGWNKYLVPDTVYGLNIRVVCCIHDDDYERGGTQKDKDKADNNIHDNIDIIIDLFDRWYYPTKLAKLRANTYRNVVQKAGDSAFNFKKEVV